MKITMDDVHEYFPGITWQQFILFDFLQNGEPYRSILMNKRLKEIQTTVNL
jgi:hypothetical protein